MTLGVPQDSLRKGNSPKSAGLKGTKTREDQENIVQQEAWRTPFHTSLYTLFFETGTRTSTNFCTKSASRPCSTVWSWSGSQQKDLVSWCEVNTPESQNCDLRGLISLSFPGDSTLQMSSGIFNYNCDLRFQSTTAALRVYTPRWHILGPGKLTNIYPNTLHSLAFHTISKEGHRLCLGSRQWHFHRSVQHNPASLGLLLIQFINFDKEWVLCGLNQSITWI